ncbi:MAG: FMN-binding protein [Bacteroidetes bacterium]|nr:FMN-binding protein [Bacteroidota bacterium]MBU1115531.1 FMN-binding protein [Bacteroidota bacterium]MBU1799583.1 FMN-binding protein [Bacteroidota bacterium]
MLKLFLIFILINKVIFANGIEQKVKEIIKNQFGNNVQVDFNKYKIPLELKNEIENKVKQKFFAESVFIWLIKENDSLLAVAIMDNVYGKAQPITFITFLGENGKILSNHIVKYREEHGSAVSNFNWNKQFIGRDEKYDFNKIDAISGATISVNSIKKGVHKLVLLYKTLDKTELWK